MVHIEISLDVSTIQDQDMYHEESDTAAIARTSNLNEELGQVFVVHPWIRILSKWKIFACQARAHIFFLCFGTEGIGI